MVATSNLGFDVDAAKFLPKWVKENLRKQEARVKVKGGSLLAWGRGLGGRHSGLSSLSAFQVARALKKPVAFRLFRIIVCGVHLLVLTTLCF